MPCWPPTAGTALRPPRKRPTSKWLSSARSGATWLAGPARPAGKLGFESHVVTVDGLDALAGALEGKNTELVRASGTVESLREVKDAGELALLRLACEAADAALTDLVAREACGRAEPNGR